MLGSATALFWGITSVALAQAGRLAGTWTTILWTSTFASGGTALAAGVGGQPDGTFHSWTLVLLSGIAYLISMVTYVAAVRRSAVSLVAPIVACDGAIAALIAVLAGQSLGAGTTIGLAAMVLALMLVTIGGEDETAGPSLVERKVGPTVILELVSAVAFSLVFYISGQISGPSPLWVVAGVRLIPAAVALAVCLRAGEVAVPRQAMPAVFLGGLVEAGGYVCYVFAARSSVPVAAVTTSQYAGIAVLGGIIFFGERLRRRQLLGVVILLAGVGIVGAAG